MSLLGGKFGLVGFVVDVVVLFVLGDVYFVNGVCWDINGGLYMC